MQQITQEQKGAAFRALHEGEAFIIPNPWDAGSARALEALGFKALATTSSGFAFTLGRPDGGATLDDVAEHVRTLSHATSLPARSRPRSIDRYEYARGAPTTVRSPAASCCISVCEPKTPLTQTTVPSRAVMSRARSIRVGMAAVCGARATACGHPRVRRLPPP